MVRQAAETGSNRWAIFTANASWTIGSFVGISTLSQREREPDEENQILISRQNSRNLLQRGADDLQKQDKAALGNEFKTIGEFL